MATPRYSYTVRPSTMYHSSTVYERQAPLAGGAGSRGLFTGPAGVGHAGRAKVERAKGRPALSGLRSEERSDERRGKTGPKRAPGGERDSKRGVAVLPVPAPASRTGVPGGGPRAADRRARPEAPGARDAAAAPRPRAVPGRDRQGRHRRSRRRGARGDQHAPDRPGGRRGRDVPVLVRRVQGRTARPHAERDRGRDRGAGPVR